MKILLCEDIDKLGWLGDVVEVTNGYARNYLLPQRKGIVPTEANIKSLSEKKAQRAQERKLAEGKLKQIAQTVEGAEAVIAALANEQGHLFGSVGPKDIAENLRAQGLEVPDAVVQLDEHIKETGEHLVTLKFSKDSTATVKVVVVAQGQSEETEDESTDKNTE